MAFLPTSSGKFTPWRRDKLNRIRWFIMGRPRLTKEQFDRKHGKGAFALIRVLLRDPSHTYVKIGREIGISKQRISRIAQFLRIDGIRRQKKRTSHRPPSLTNTRAKYYPNIRRVIDELTRRGFPVEPFYNVDNRHHVRKQLRTVLLTGVPCKIRYRNARTHDHYAPFEVTSHVQKAKIVVYGVQHGKAFRLYVIPIAELKNVTATYFPVSGRYVGTPRKPKRDWTRFENAWHLLRGRGH